MLAEGRGAWWNAFGNVSIAKCIERAACLDYVIIKRGYPDVEDAFRAAGIRYGTERFVYPSQPLAEAKMLADAVDAGAQFVVVNAEDWFDWGAQHTGETMRILLDELWRRYPGLEVYASVDTRADRNYLPFQAELLERCTAVLPMIYPFTFYPRRPSGYVERAFSDCLDDKEFYGKPVIPTIQIYGSIGLDAVRAELEELSRRGFTNYNLYTICHATDAEWTVVQKQARQEEIMLQDQINELKTKTDATNHRVDVLQVMASLHGAINDDDMTALVLRMIYFGILAGGVAPLKPHLT